MVEHDDCKYSETIGALKQDTINLVRWQKSQNDKLETIDKRLFQLTILALSTLAGVVVNLLL
ncbi:MAG TPA: hypothetical protein PLR82_08475 [Bacillota bacterium]|nr:hypothetical protein [Bacillota bacterium]